MSPNVLDLTEMEFGALASFRSAPGPLRDALEKFTAHMADQHKALCSAAMATVPRHTELASDHAAKAQLLDEFWTYLEDALRESAAVAAPAPEV